MTLSGTDFWRLRVRDLRIVSLIDDVKRGVVVLREARRSESTSRSVDR